MPTVRRAVATDLDAVLVLVAAFCVADQHEFDDTRVRRALAPLLRDDEHGQVWVLDNGDTLAGYAVVTWGWSLESDGRESLLDEIFVSDQGGGHGALLMGAVLNGARDAGARTMFLETEALNERVRRFYDRHGFTVDDSVWMSTLLD